MTGFSFKMKSMLNVFGPLCMSGAMMLGSQAQAKDLSELLPSLVADHPLISAAASDAEASSFTLQEKKWQWAPELSVTSSAGRENINKPDAADTELTAKYVNVSLDQTIWDFGRKNADIDSAAALADQKSVVAEANRQKVRLEGIKAYAEIVRWRNIVSFAQQSVDNVKRQTEMENARVEKGRGLTTDVMQAKTQLAGAEARLVQAKTQYTKAMNEFFRVFGNIEVDFSTFKAVTFADDKLPRSIEEALELAHKNSFDIQIGQKTVQALNANVSSQFADSYMPELDAKISSTYKNDYSGTENTRSEFVAKVELTWDLNFGLAGYKAYNASLKRHSAGQARLTDTVRLVERKVQNAWEDYNSAQQNVNLLVNQEALVSEYLRLARIERRAGRRSLLDVLSGETALYNARSDAASSRVDAVVAGFTLLFNVGALDETAYSSEQAQVQTEQDTTVQ